MNWRPRNETAEDLEREANIIDTVAAYLGNLRWVKLSETLYGVDAALFDGTGLVAWVEAKARTKDYDPILCSLAKVMSGYRWGKATERPSYFVVSTPSGIFLHRLQSPTGYTVALAGSSRGQNGDQEPCAMIPFSFFTQISPPQP